MNDQWGRVCYKHKNSKYQDGYARQHWITLDQAKKVLDQLKERGVDCFIEIAHPTLNKASGERIT